MKLTACGIDLAKAVFQVHGVDLQGKPCLRRQLRRAEMLTLFVKFEPCLIGIEACSSAHCWACKVSEMGHTVKLVAPRFVKPYVKTNENDAAGAEAICESGHSAQYAFRGDQDRTAAGVAGVIPPQKERV